VRNPGRLVAFSAIGHWRQIGRIGFHEQPFTGDETQKVIIRPFFESHDPGKRDVPARIDRELGECVRSSVAMKDSDDAGSSRIPNHGPGVVFRFTRVYDDRLPHLGSERNLGGEHGALDFARRVVVVVVESTLSDRDSGVADQGSQLWKIPPGLKTSGVVRVNPGGGKNEARIVSGESGSYSRCRQRLANAHHRIRARVAGAGDYLVAVAVERRVREVGVAVDEAVRVPVLRGHLRSIQRSTGAAT
jgi:hypothetical protein